eukprot:CAMPEP_0119550926 /NCGR_PEP_ID=MMETSP1352-20130426/4355_1 /TAXON_ID=265584 /ORGANISM="Stauroneis constricta, Strain CCMP1120" /LENGTH=158 /DNA_ID=CAMNT_0007596917 /DNA_START=77 /DNA_END=553 /DNA_ORIENTATION=+
MPRRSVKNDGAIQVLTDATTTTTATPERKNKKRKKSNRRPNALKLFITIVVIIMMIINAGIFYYLIRRKLMNHGTQQNKNDKQVGTTSLRGGSEVGVRNTIEQSKSQLNSNNQQQLKEEESGEEDQDGEMLNKVEKKSHALIKRFAKHVGGHKIHHVQ